MNDAETAGPRGATPSPDDAEVRAEQRYLTLADMLPSQVWTARPDGALDYVNQRVLDYFQRSAAQIIGQGWKDFVHPDDLPICAARWAHSLETGHPYDVEFRLRRADGLYRWHQGLARALRDSAGRIVQWLGTNSDIEEALHSRRRLQEGEYALRHSEAAREQAEKARQRTQQILAGIDGAFVVCAEDWQIVFVNDEGAALLGRTVADLQGLSVWDVASEALGPAMGEHLRRVMKDREAVTAEDCIPPRDLWREVSAYPLRDGGIAFHARDITARKREESRQARVASYAALRAEVSTALAGRREIKEVLQGCCEAVVTNLAVSFVRVWTLDSTGEWLELCASAGKYTHVDGAHRRVRVGELKIGLIAAERRPYWTNAVLDDPRVANKEWARREGMVAFAGFPLLAADALQGVMAGFATEALPDDAVLTLQGVADAVAQGIARRRAELELDARARELARSNADLEQFAYVASHDLQEPLRIVAGYTQLLARRYKGRLDQDADDFIAFTVDGVARMQRLISDLLAYSRVGTRGQPFGPVEMEKVLAGALANLRQAITDAAAEVTHDSLPPVTGDEGQLIQLMQNLVGNAVKFHGPNSPRVHIGFERDGNDWQFTVADNGVGIEPQYFERIFVIFQRLHSMDKYPGTGIGLALCKKIVERHGGRIWLESKVGEGSVFRFTLPALVPAS